MPRVSSPRVSTSTAIGRVLSAAGSATAATPTTSLRWNPSTPYRFEVAPMPNGTISRRKRQARDSGLGSCSRSDGEKTSLRVTSSGTSSDGCAAAQHLPGGRRVAVEVELGDGAGVARLVPRAAQADQALHQQRQFRVAVEGPRQHRQRAQGDDGDLLGVLAHQVAMSLSLASLWCSWAQGNLTPPRPPGPCSRVPSMS